MVEKLDAQVPEIEGANTQRVPDPGQDRRGARRLPNKFDVALSGDHRIKRIQQDADRGRQPHALSRRPRPFKQKGPRRLQLVGKRRLLTDRHAISRRQILVGIKNAGDRAQVDGEFADRFARDHPASAGVGENSRQERNDDIGDPTAREQQLSPNCGRKGFAWKPQNEDHRDDHLHADGHRPSPEPGDQTADETDDPDHEERGERPRQRELDRNCREHRQHEAENERPRFLAPRRRKVGNAGRYGAQRRRLAGGEAENRRGYERDHDHASADAYAVDDVLADKKPREILGARPARHEGPAKFLRGRHALFQ